MKVIYAQEPFPSEVSKSIFLAGPTPRDPGVQSWRPEALSLLHSWGYDGHVFVPEPRNGVWNKDYLAQVSWEGEGLERADCIVFWIPRVMATMPGLTTNDEWGAWKSSGKAVLGTPPDAAHVSYQKYYAKELGVPHSATLADTLATAVSKIGDGSVRNGGECCVPLHIWQKPEFQAWYRTQRLAGNRLDGARVVWSFRVGPQRAIFVYALHVNVFIRAENRSKTNEIVIFRPDTSTVALYRKGTTTEETEIVLVREFRSPARTVTGMLHELPSGSSGDAAHTSRDVAAHELEEETGFTIDPTRLKLHQTRQYAGTLSAHVGTLFSAELTAEEMAVVRTQVGQAHGVIEDTERTYVEVTTLASVLKGNLVDWSTVGMIFQAMYGA